MTNDIIKRLEASMRFDVINGDESERAILGLQINEAIRVLKYLSGRDTVLSKLESAGVDNWEGYDDAIGGSRYVASGYAEKGKGSERLNLEYTEVEIHFPEVNVEDIAISMPADKLIGPLKEMKGYLDELGRQITILKSPTYIVAGGNPFRGYTNTLSFTGLKSLGEFKCKEDADECVNLHYEDCGGLIAIFEVKK